MVGDDDRLVQRHDITELHPRLRRRADGQALDRLECRRTSEPMRDHSSRSWGARRTHRGHVERQIRLEPTRQGQLVQTGRGAVREELAGTEPDRVGAAVVEQRLRRAIRVDAVVRVHEVPALGMPDTVAKQDEERRKSSTTARRLSSGRIPCTGASGTESSQAG